MLSNRFSLLFYLKKPKKYVKGRQPICLRITINAERIELSMQRECEPERWNSHAGRVNGTKEDIRSLNVYLDSLQAKVYEAHRSLLDKNEVITIGSIKKKLRGITDRPRMILEVFQEHNNQVTQLIGKDFAAGTLQRYKTTLEHTRNFIAWKYNVPDMDITKLNHEFISDFGFWLKSIRNCNHNSTMKYLANFKKIVLICVKNGWLQKDPFFTNKFRKKEVVREYLSENKLQTVQEKPFASERLERVRAIFLFCCYTGFAYADVKKLKCSEIRIGIDARKWIFTFRQKTGTPSKIPILPDSLVLIEKYVSHAECVNKGMILPVLSNQKMNSYLKEITDVCGISKEVTFHIARHTYATTITFNNGVPIGTVSKMLGHTNVKTTQHYAKLINIKISEDMKALSAKLSAAII